MMYKLLSGVILIVLLSACSNKKAKVSFILSKNVKAPEITIRFANKVDSILRPKVDNNQFNVETGHKQFQLGYAYIAAGSKKSFVIFFTEPNNKIEINIDSNLKVSQVKGGSLNQEFLQFNTKTLGNWSKMEEAFRQQADMVMEVRPMARDSLANIYQQILQQRLELVKQHIAKNNQSNLSPILTLMYFEKDIEQMRNSYALLDKQAQNSFYGKELKARLDMYKGVVLGDKAPEFSLPNIQKKLISLKEIYSQNKYTLVDFWASWCGPCRGENPNLVETYDKYKQKGLGIIGVSIDEDLEQWANAIKNDNLSWQQVVDDKGWSSPTAQAYGVEGIPANFLVDNTGKIIAKNLRGDDLGLKLQELLK